MQLRPAGEVQTVMRAMMVPVVPVMMVPAPVVMPVTVVAVMPVPVMPAIPPVVAHFDEVRIRQPGQPDSCAEIGGFGWFWRLHEQAKAKS